MMRSFFFGLLLIPLSGIANDALLESWNSGVAFLEQRVARDAEDFMAWNLLVDRYLRRERWTGDPEDLRRAAVAVRHSLAAVPAEVNLGGLFASARVAMAQHRFGDALAAAEKLRSWQPQKSFSWELLGDAQLELGDVESAAASYNELKRIDESSIGTESRLARLAQIRGDIQEVRRHLELTLELAEQGGSAAPDVIAWSRVQLGEFAFRSGDWESASTHYRAALVVAPEQWSVLEHVAELEAAQGHDTEALELYSRALARSSRPEVWQMLGDYHAFMKRSAEAKKCHERALALYLASVECGEVHYYHHLAGLFADSFEQGNEALKWARKDFALRQSIYAWDALGWAHYKRGDFAEALKTLEHTLRTGTKDAHLLYHAAMIRMSSGDLAGGKAALQAALAANPRYNSFHAHR